MYVSLSCQFTGWFLLLLTLKLFSFYMYTFIILHLNSIQSLKKYLSEELILKYIYASMLQLISYKRYLECTLIQWRLSIYP